MKGWKKLKQLLLDMGDRVERAIEAAMRALQALDGEAARR